MLKDTTMLYNAKNNILNWSWCWHVIDLVKRKRERAL